MIILVDFEVVIDAVVIVMIEKIIAKLNKRKNINAVVIIL